MSEKLNWQNITPGREDNIEIAHAMALSENETRTEYDEAIETINEKRDLFRDTLRHGLLDEGIDPDTFISDDEIEQMFEDIIVAPIRIGVEKIGPKLSERAARRERGEYFGDDIDAPYAYSSEEYKNAIVDIAIDDPEVADSLMQITRDHFGPGGKHADELIDEAKLLHEFEKKKAA